MITSLSFSFSDNLQRLQAEIAGMKSQLSAGRNEWEKFRELTLVRVKEMHSLYVKESCIFRLN